MNRILSLIENNSTLLLYLVATASGIALLWGLVSLYLRLKPSPYKGKKVPLRERLYRRHAEIVLEGDRKKEPLYLTLSIRNPGRRSLDLEAPVIVFRRWKSSRKFRIRSFGRVDEFPIFLDPGYEAVYTINLNYFYDRVPILKKATRVDLIVQEATGKKFKSNTLRLRKI